MTVPHHPRLLRDHKAPLAAFVAAAVMSLALMVHLASQPGTTAWVPPSATAPLTSRLVQRVLGTTRPVLRSQVVRPAPPPQVDTPVGAPATDGRPAGSGPVTWPAPTSGTAVAPTAAPTVAAAVSFAPAVRPQVSRTGTGARRQSAPQRLLRQHRVRQQEVGRRVTPHVRRITTAALRGARPSGDRTRAARVRAARPVVAARPVAVARPHPQPRPPRQATAHGLATAPGWTGRRQDGHPSGAVGGRVAADDHGHAWGHVAGHDHGHAWDHGHGQGPDSGSLDRHGHDHVHGHAQGHAESHAEGRTGSHAEGHAEGHAESRGCEHGQAHGHGRGEGHGSVHGHHGGRRH